MLGKKYNMINLTEFVVLISLSVAAPEQMFTNNETINFDIPQEEITCLADNVYHEARNQSTGGWYAVIAVTLNRVKDSRFPNTVCEVVKQGEHRPSWKGTGELIPVRNRCQFSWYCDGKSDTINKRSITQYKDITELATIALISNVVLLDITDGATHYHADYVSPSWAKTKTKTIEIGDHIFYRWER